MISLETFRSSAQALPGVSEQIHFGLNAFAVGKKRFTAFDPKTGELSLKLPLRDPIRTAGIDKGLLSPAPGKYGAEGWTTVDLDRIEKTEFVKLLEAAFNGVAPKAKPETIDTKQTKTVKAKIGLRTSK